MLLTFTRKYVFAFLFAGLGLVAKADTLVLTYGGQISGVSGNPDVTIGEPWSAVATFSTNNGSVLEGGDWVSYLQGPNNGLTVTVGSYTFSGYGWPNTILDWGDVIPASDQFIGIGSVFSSGTTNYPGGEIFFAVTLAGETGLVNDSSAIPTSINVADIDPTALNTHLDVVLQEKDSGVTLGFTGSVTTVYEYVLPDTSPSVVPEPTSALMVGAVLAGALIVFGIREIKRSRIGEIAT